MWTEMSFERTEEKNPPKIFCVLWAKQLKERNIIMRNKFLQTSALILGLSFVFGNGVSAEGAWCQCQCSEGEAFNAERYVNSRRSMEKESRCKRACMGTCAGRGLEMNWRQVVY